jgi:hypothetical protein
MNPLQFGGKRPGKQHIGARQDRQVQIGLFGDFGAQRIDHNKPTTLAFGAADAAYEVQIGNRRVVAPNDVEFSVLGEFGRHSGHRAIGSGPRLAAYTAAQSAAVNDAGPEPVEKAQ